MSDVFSASVQVALYLKPWQFNSGKESIDNWGVRGEFTVDSSKYYDNRHLLTFKIHFCF